MLRDATHRGDRMTSIDKTNKGRRVELVHTNDPYTKLQAGSRGTYEMCIRQEEGGDQHCIHWDDGSNLMLIEGVDSFKFVDKKCPKCDSELVGIFFMGDKSRPPEFLACRKCHIAYDPDTLKVLANVVF